MAIEFYCPGCGALMGTPDATAGGKGRCPYCQTKVRIPNASMSKGSPSLNQAIFDLDPNAGQAQHSASAGQIQFACNSCHTNLRVPAVNAGKKGQCPHCHAVMQIPATATTSQKTPPAQKWKGPTPPAAGHIQFSCPQCQNLVQVSESATGKRGRCPRCQAVIKIPLPSTPLSSGLQLLGDDAIGLTPLNDPSGLTPLNDSGLTPLDDSGLTPLDDGFGKE